MKKIIGAIAGVYLLIVGLLVWLIYDADINDIDV